MHIVEPMVRTADYGYGTVTTCCPNPHLVKNAENKLRALAKKLARSDSERAILVRTGVAETEILEAARAMDADLIVMGGHENRNSSQACIGSTAERVVRDAACPVLVVRERESAFNSVRKPRNQNEAT
jgi:nucleotide-binding universal stress UspA family protein